jgi:hypothetical protein
MKSLCSQALCLMGLSAASAVALTTASFAQAQTTTGATGQQQQITTAESAAPSSISGAATIAVNENGKLRTLREGTNGWTCLTSFPASSTQAAEMAGKPICVDKNGLEWIQAWMEHKNPPANRISAAYMLQGVSASALDPFATGRQQGTSWIQVGPHVMVLGAKGLREGLSASVPTGKSRIDTSKPFVMWPGTPYEHLMIPIGESSSPQVR